MSQNSGSKLEAIFSPVEKSRETVTPDLPPKVFLIHNTIWGPDEKSRRTQELDCHIIQPLHSEVSFHPARFRNSVASRFPVSSQSFRGERDKQPNIDAIFLLSRRRGTTTNFAYWTSRTVVCPFTFMQTCPFFPHQKIHFWSLFSRRKTWTKNADSFLPYFLEKDFFVKREKGGGQKEPRERLSPSFHGVLAFSPRFLWADFRSTKRRYESVRFSKGLILTFWACIHYLIYTNTICLTASSESCVKVSKWTMILKCSTNVLHQTFLIIYPTTRNIVDIKFQYKPSTIRKNIHLWNAKLSCRRLQESLPFPFSRFCFVFSLDMISISNLPVPRKRRCRPIFRENSRRKAK